MKKIIYLIAGLKTILWTTYYKLKIKKIGKGTTIMGKITIWNGENITIGKECHIHSGTMLNAYKAKIKIGNKVVISPQTRLITPSLKFKKHYEERTHIGKNITIEDEVWLATNSTIIGGVKIGKGSIIGTCSLVTKNVKPYTFVAGIPATKKRNI